RCSSARSHSASCTCRYDGPGWRAMFFPGRVRALAHVARGAWLRAESVRGDGRWAGIEEGSMSTPRNCPQCGLTNPPGTARCDCGHNFDGPSLPSRNRSDRVTKMAAKPQGYAFGWYIACSSLAWIIHERAAPVVSESLKSNVDAC